MLQSQDSLLKGRWCVACIHFKYRLTDDLTLIVSVVDQVYRSARLRFTRCDHCLVNAYTEHALTPKLGEKGRMDIQNPI